MKCGAVLFNFCTFATQYSSYTNPLNYHQMLVGLLCFLTTFYNERSGLDGVLVRGIVLLRVNFLYRKFWNFCFYSFIFFKIHFIAHETPPSTLFAALLVSNYWIFSCGELEIWVASWQHTFYLQGFGTVTLLVLHQN